MELVFWSVLAALAALGFIELVRMAVFWLLRPQRPGSGALVIAPRGSEDCEQLIRAGMARLQWLDWRGCPLVCLAPEGSDAEAVCRVFQRRYPNLLLCKRDERVYDILQEQDNG